MGMPRLIKLPRHKQFSYEPIYYDERKEQLKERISKIEGEMGIKKEGEVQRTMSKGSFSYFNDKKRQAQKFSSIRLILIILFLFLITYFLLYK